MAPPRRRLRATSMQRRMIQMQRRLPQTPHIPTLRMTAVVRKHTSNHTRSMGISLTIRPGLFIRRIRSPERRPFRMLSSRPTIFDSLDRARSPPNTKSVIGSVKAAWEPSTRHDRGHSTGLSLSRW